MANFDLFISHSSHNKELARLTWTCAISNGVKTWFDEALLETGNEIDTALQVAISDSDTYLLFASESALNSKWVKLEMQIAEARKRVDPEFRIIVVLIDHNLTLPEWWQKFLYMSWKNEDEAGSVIQLLESLTGRKVFSWITGAAFLSAEPSSIYFNDSGSLAEHSRNWVLYYIGHLKQLLSALAMVGHPSEHQDSIEKILKLSLLDQIPSIQSGWIAIEPGVFESIHPNRMRIPPRIKINGLPPQYSFSVLANDEISTRISFLDNLTNARVTHPIPFSVEMDAEL